MARKPTRNRMDLRAQHEAFEARKADEEQTEEVEDEDGEDEDEDEDEDEEGEEAAEEAGDGDEEGGGDDDDEEVKPKKKKAKAKAKPKAVKPAKEAKPKRTRTPKVVRMKVVWGVFNNSNQRVQTFPYPQKKEAEEMAVKLKGESKTNQTYFVQPVKEPMEA